MKPIVSPGHFCIAVIALLFSFVSIGARSETATVLGTVRDSNGAAVVGAKPPLIRNQFGFTLGGPIIQEAIKTVLSIF